MRERKYRYWDNKPFDEKPKMIYLDEPDFSGGSDCVFCTGNRVYSKYWDFSDHCDCIYELRDVIVTEYTGLKDKNGVEIYEGDIVKANLRRKGIEIIGRVAMPKSCWVVTFLNEPVGYYNSRRTAEFDELEIIGNVHQNPELLK